MNLSTSSPGINFFSIKSLCCYILYLLLADIKDMSYLYNVYSRRPLIRQAIGCCFLRTFPLPVSATLYFCALYVFARSFYQRHLRDLRALILTLIPLTTQILRYKISVLSVICESLSFDSRLSAVRQPIVCRSTTDLSSFVSQSFDTCEQTGCHVSADLLTRVS